MPPPVRYTRSGEINLAYQVIGSGPVDIALCMGSYSHLDVLWESAQFTRLFERVGEFARLLLFDRRGVGLSDRLAEPQTLEQRNDDIRAVLDAAGSERAFILGLSEGGNMATLFAATYPDRTIGLILHGSKPRWAWAPDWPYGTTQEEFEQTWRTAAERNHEDDFSTERWRRWMGSTLHDDPSFREWWQRMRDRWPRRQRATSNRS
ncbi:MAG: alpha/beta fold hydrolase [Candidatus Limnocylindria bacterium]